MIHARRMRNARPDDVDASATVLWAELSDLAARFATFHLRLRGTDLDTVPQARLLEPDNAVVGDWLALQGRRTDGANEALDDKTRGSYILGHIAHRLCFSLAALTLAGDRALVFPDGPLTDGALGWRVSHEAWAHDDDAGKAMSGIALRLDPVVDAACLVDASDLNEPARIDLCRRAILSVFTPLVPVIKARSGLGVTAGWRVVADMAAAAFLHFGKLADDPERGMRLGTMLVRGEKSSLTNNQVGYLPIELREDAGSALLDAEWFLDRGGCCRWYTTQDPVAYCATCVLLKREDKIEKLTAYLARRRVLAQAEVGAGKGSA